MARYNDKMLREKEKIRLGRNLMHCWENSVCKDNQTEVLKIFLFISQENINRGSIDQDSLSIIDSIPQEVLQPILCAGLNGMKLPGERRWQAAKWRA
jgi:hypothetical protein